MNTPPDLVAAFAARLDRVLEHLRGELRTGDVLVYRAAFWTSKSELAPLTVGRGPEAAPLTVADALEVVTASRDLLAAAFAEELGLAVGALVPEVHQTWALKDPAVLAAWPVRVAGLPGFDGIGRSAPPPGPVEALSHLLERVPNLPGELAPDLDTLPAVASWARSAPLVDDAGRYLGSFPSCGLNALYRNLRAHSPLFAAVEAGRLVRELVSDEGSRLWLAAVDAALTAGEPDALADFARKDVARRVGYAGALVAAARTVADRVFTAPAPVDDAAARETTGTPRALLWDRRFAAELDRLGGARTKDVLALAGDRATSGADLWHLWAPVYGPPRWLRALARELWLSVWRPALERERRPVALSRFAVERIGGVLLGRDVVPGPGGRDVLVDGTGRAIAPFELQRLTTQVDADALELLARPGVRALTTIAAARFVPWFAEQVQRRPDEQAPIVFEGTDGVNAWGTVAAALGMDAGKHALEVRNMVHALQATIIQYPNGDEAGVLHFDYRAGKSGRGNRSRLTVHPGRPWLSSDVHTLPDSAEYRALAPIPALEGYAPPFVGDRTERAALARLWLCLLVELTRGSPDLSRGLGVHIPGSRWAELANTVGVRRPPPVLVSLLQNRWAVDGDDGAAVLERVGPDRWNLAPRFEAERAMLEAGGRMRLGAAEGGRRSVRARNEERERLAAGLPRAPKGRKGS